MISFFFEAIIRRFVQYSCSVSPKESSVLPRFLTRCSLAPIRTKKKTIVLAVLSENADRKVKKYHVIRKEEIISGGESVGMILSGENFQTRYFGNYLRNENAAESATAVQVSASLFAAYKYIQNHPRLGMLFPEEVDHREVLKTAKKELGEYISKVL